MRLVTVGTGTVVPDASRASSCHWVEDGDTRIIVDCGAGALQGLARCKLPWAATDHLIISHFHADHIAEVPSLIFALRHALEVPRTAPLGVWGPAGTERVFAAWASAFGSWIVAPGFDLKLHEVGPGTRLPIGGMSARFAGTRHTEESLAVRLECGDSTLGYTGDTGPSAELADFFRDVTLLLAECSLPDELAQDNHLTPTGLAQLAQGAAVKRLAVTHVYPQLQRLDVPQLLRDAGFSGEIVMAYDGLELEV